MEPIAKHLDRAMATSSKTGPDKVIDLELIRGAFKQLRNAYRDSFAPLKRKPKESDKQYKDTVNNILNTWAAALSGLTEQEIKTGVLKCIRELRWGSMITPADIVSRAKILPEDIGAPSIAEAFDECINNRPRDPDKRRWSHGVVYAAFKSIPGNQWASMVDKEIRQLFRYNYLVILRRALNGQEFDVPVPIAIEKEDGHVPCSPDVAEKNLAACRQAVKAGENKNNG